MCTSIALPDTFFKHIPAAAGIHLKPTTIVKNAKRPRPLLQFRSPRIEKPAETFRIH